jgi:hypothetical protein
VLEIQCLIGLIEVNWADKMPRIPVRSLRGLRVKGKEEKVGGPWGGVARWVAAALRCVALRIAASSRRPALLRQP